MFEKIVLRRSDEGPEITAGELAEALLFYQNVHLILDYGSLNGLISQIGMSTIVSLLTRPNISAVYCENTLATHTETKGNTSNHEFIAFSFAGDQKVGELNSKGKLLEYILTIKNGYQKKQAKRLAERFRLKVPFRDLTGNHFIEGGIVEAANIDLTDENFIHEAIRVSLSSMLGLENTPSNFVFKARSENSGFSIDTDLKFDEINNLIRKRKSHSGKLTPAHLIGKVLNARGDTILASYYGGDFYTSDTTSEIIRLKYSELLRRTGIERKELKEFEEIVVSTGRSLREVINSGERSFDEFLKVLDKSLKFREWAKGVNPDKKLVKEYWSEVSATGWIDKLPSKAIKYIISSTIGAIEPISGHAVSVADTFLLDKIVGGWKPSHFVERSLIPFINNHE